MAMVVGEVEMTKPMQGQSITIDVHVRPGVFTRLKIAKLLLRMAVWVLGANIKSIDIYHEPDMLHRK